MSELDSLSLNIQRASLPLSESLLSTLEAEKSRTLNGEPARLLQAIPEAS